MWELITGSGQRPSQDAVYEAVTIEYEDKLDRSLLDKAMWETSKSVCGDIMDEKSISKIFRALSGAYWPALDAVLEERVVQEMHGFPPPEAELYHVETFLKQWIDDSMRRCWGAIQDAETTMTAEVAEAIFRTLVAPFGKEDPFSCIPSELTMIIGRPPTDWAYITECCTNVFTQWGGATGIPASKKRRKQGASGETWEEPTAVAAVRAPVRKVPQAGAGKAKLSQDGHPQCTSEGDCIGTPANSLYQHMLNGDAGDIYCQPCWESFVRRNPQLEGVPL